jgi:type III pantothenate kinase
MILTIDIGNTNIVIGCMDETNNNNTPILEERIYTDIKKSSVEYAITLRTLLDIHGIDPSDLAGGIISSSVPPVTANVHKAAETLLGKKVLEVGPGIKTGVDIKINDPAQLGPDLLTGAVAGLAEYGAPLILIDIGTATTISVINDKRRFMGGMILPGIHVSLDGLSHRAAHLPQIAIEKPKKLICSSTVEAMQSGILYGHASCIDGMVERIWEDLGYKTPVVATGGLAQKVISCCKQDIVVDDQLLLKGLMIIYKKNS